MINISNPEVSDLIKVTGAGVETANLSEIISVLQNRYRAIYGTEVDMSTGTADGVMVYSQALLIDSILQAIAAAYSNLDISKARGQYLDILVKLLNFDRIQPSSSVASLLLTNLSSSAQQYTGMTFVDKSGQTWSTSEMINLGAAGSGTDTQTVTVHCTRTGPIAAPAGSIIKTVSTTYISVSQTAAATLGTDLESDASLKARATTPLSVTGITALSSLCGKLFALDGVVDVKVYNNNTGSSITAKDTTSIASKNIYVIVRLRVGSSLSDASIGTVIHDALTPGVKTTQAGSGGHSYTYIEQVDSIGTLSYANQVIYWKQAQGTNLNGVSITVEPTVYFTEDELDSIALDLIEWMNGMPIGAQLTQDDVFAKLVELDPRPAGNATYSNVDFTATVSDNPDRYYNFTSYAITHGGTPVRYQITFS